MEDREIEELILLDLKYSMSVFLYVASVSLIQYTPSFMKLGIITSFTIIIGVFIHLRKMIMYGSLCTLGYYVVLVGYFIVFIVDIENWGYLFDAIRFGTLF